MKTPSSLRSLMLALSLSFGSLAEAAPEPTFTRITDSQSVLNGLQSVVASWADVDGDGYVDLFLGGENVDHLFYNDGNGTLALRATLSPWLGNFTKPAALDGRTAAWGDYDNDGWLDLFLANGGFGSGIARTNRLYHNIGGQRAEVVTSGPIATTRANSPAAAWVDYDRDGYLDLWVGNWDNRRSDFLYHGDGQGGFKAVSSPISNEGIDTLGGAWADFDNDGDQDLVVTGYIFANGVLTAPNLLFVNDGNGSFTQPSPTPFGPTQFPNSNSRHAAWADYDNDGDLDLYLTYDYRPNLLFRNDGDGSFTQIMAAGGIVTDVAASIGCAWGDYDNDGWIDLFVAGFTGTSDNDIQPWHNYLYRNNGNGTFSNLTNPITEEVAMNVSGSWADLDNDGFLDLVVAKYTDGTSLFRNGGNGNGWLLIKLVGTVSNRAAIGAKVRAKATIAGKAMWQMRQVGGNHDTQGGSDLRVHFGLGDAIRIDVLQVEWPSGTVQTLTNVAANRVLTITEPPRLSVTGMGRFVVRGLKDVTYTIQSSGDLAAWTAVGSVAGGGGLLDPASPASSARFYRAVAP